MVEELSEGLSPPETKPDIGESWHEFVRTYFAGYVSNDLGEPIPFADHHTALFEWVWSLEKGKRPQPFVAIWSRGHAKSTLAEMAVVAVGAKRSRNYVLYISGTQDQADDHVENIGAMLEEATVSHAYPELSERKIGKYGASKGWRRNRLRTASGLTVDAMGLDSASRGAKVDEDRPDLIVLDDIDGELDTQKTTDKKMKVLARRLLPAGADDLAVLAVQNLVHESSVFAQLADGSAGILSDRIVSGPIPAIENLDYDDSSHPVQLTGGTATWDGMPFGRCQEIVNDIGLEGFLPEYQHSGDKGSDAFSTEWFDRYDPSDPRYANKAIARFIAWDTAAKDNETNAYTACVVGELLPDWRLLIRYVDRDRVTFDALPDYAIREASALKPDGKFRACIIEDASSGEDLIPVLRKTGPDWLRQRVADVRPHRSKEVSWNAAAFWCKRRCVLLPEPSEDAPWLRDFERELFKVPNTRFKDQADAFALLINYLEETESVMSRGLAAREAAKAAS